VHPSLTVVVPAFDEEERLGSCLERLSTQTHPIDEIIVVDNCSTDDTVRIAQSHQRLNPAIRILAESTVGVNAARTRGFDAATSALIAKIDADTGVPANWSDSVCGFFEADTHADVAAITGPSLVSDGPRMAPPIRRLEHLTRRFPAGVRTGALNGPDYVIRRSAWQAVRPALHDDQDIWEDYDLSLALHGAGFEMWMLPSIAVRTSCRRLRHSPLANHRYLTAPLRTARRHGVGRRQLVVVRFRLVGVFLNATIMWILCRPWDHETRTWRLRRLFRPLQREATLAADRS